MARVETSPLALPRYFTEPAPVRAAASAARILAPGMKPPTTAARPRLYLWLSAVGAESSGFGNRCNALADGSMPIRSEEHTSELQSLMRISYAVFCLQHKTTNNQ